MLCTPLLDTAHNVSNAISFAISSHFCIFNVLAIFSNSFSTESNVSCVFILLRISTKGPYNLRLMASRVSSTSAESSALYCGLGLHHSSAQCQQPILSIFAPKNLMIESFIGSIDHRDLIQTQDWLLALSRRMMETYATTLSKGMQMIPLTLRTLSMP